MSSVLEYNWGKKRFDIYLLIIIHTLSVCTMCLVIFLFFYNQNNKTVLDAEYSQGIYNSSIMTEYDILSCEDDFLYSDYLYEFEKNIYDLPEVSSAGGYGFFWSDLGIWEPLIEIQQRHPAVSEELEDGLIEKLIIDETLIDFMNLEIKSGVSFRESIEIAKSMKTGDESISVVYLGAFFDEYPIGTTLEYKKSDGSVLYKYYIAGVLEEGEEWIPENFTLAPDDSLFEDMSTVPLDNLIVEICIGTSVGGNWYISYSQDVSQEEGTAAVIECANKFGAEVEIQSLYDIVSANIESYNVVTKYLLSIALMVGVIEIFIAISMQLGVFYSGRRQYGIMLASGGLRSEIKKSVFADNVFVAFFACLIGNSLIGFMISIIISNSNTTMVRETYTNIIYSKVIPISIILAILIVLIESVIPGIVIEKYSVSSLIRKYKENSRIIDVIMAFSLFANNVIFIFFYNLHLDFIGKAYALIDETGEIYDDYQNLMMLDSINKVFMWILVAISVVNVLSVSRLVFMGKARECAVKRCNGATGMNIFSDVMRYVLKMSILSLVIAVAFSYGISKMLLDNASLKSIIPALILTFVTSFVVVIVNFRKISRNKALNMIRISEE